MDSHSGGGPECGSHLAILAEKGTYESVLFTFSLELFTVWAVTSKPRELAIQWALKPISIYDQHSEWAAFVQDRNRLMRIS